jgi:hypothetical protein
MYLMSERQSLSDTLQVHILLRKLFHWKLAARRFFASWVLSAEAESPSAANMTLLQHLSTTISFRTDANRIGRKESVTMPRTVWVVLMLLESQIIIQVVARRMIQTSGRTIAIAMSIDRLWGNLLGVCSR